MSTNATTQITIVEYNQFDLKRSYLYFRTGDYIACFCPYIVESLKLETVKDKKSLDSQESKILTKELNLYLKDPDEKLLQFKVGYLGGFIPVDSEDHPESEKLDWTGDNLKFIEDGARSVATFTFEKDGSYEKKVDTATENDFNHLENTPLENLFFHPLDLLHSCFSLHDLFSNYGGIGIFKKNSYDSVCIAEISKDKLVKAKVSSTNEETKFIKDYLENHKIKIKDVFWSELPSSMIPLDLKKSKEDIEYYKENADYIKALEDLQKVVKAAFDFFKPKTAENSILQGKTTRTFQINHILNKTVTQPFLQRYDPDSEDFTQLEPVKVSKRTSPNKIFNYVSLKSIVELDYFDQLVLSAYKTWQSLYPNEPVTFLDIAHILHHPKNNNSRLDSRSRIVRDIADSFDHLRQSLCKIDFSQQAHLYKNNPDIQNYVNNGGSGIISFPYISGSGEPVKTANGEILDGFVPGGERNDRLLDGYLKMTGQIRTIKGNEQINPLINPLRATRNDLKIFHYLLYKATSMPYYNSEVNLFSQKQKFLELVEEEKGAKKSDQSNENIFRDPSSNEERPESPVDSKTLANQMSIIQVSSQKMELTIALDTLIDELKLNKRSDTSAQKTKRRNTVKRKIETVFDYWKDTGFISNYICNYKPNNRSVQSYTISFFDLCDKN